MSVRIEMKIGSGERVGEKLKVQDLNRVPLLFLCQTSRTAWVKEAARSGVTQLPLSISTTTDRLSRTRPRVSSEAAGKNGPRSLAMRGANGASAASSPPWKKLDASEDQTENI